MFIEIDNMLINLNNITSCVKFDKVFIRICFLAEGDYIDITRESEEKLNETWKWLKKVCFENGR